MEVAGSKEVASMRRIISVMVVLALMAAVVVAGAGIAAADPEENQPFNEHNCHGWVLGHMASGEPEGVGNWLKQHEVPVREFQEIVRDRCEQ